MSPEQIKLFLQSLGVSGPIAYILVIIFSTIISPLSSVPLWPFALLAWRFPLSAIYTTIGAIGGAVANFWLARKFGRLLIAKLISKKGLKLVDQVALKEGTKTLFILRLFPSGLFDYVSYAAGLTKMPFAPYFLITGFFSLFWNLITFRFLDQVLAFFGTSWYLISGYLLVMIVIFLTYLTTKKKINWAKIHHRLFLILIALLPVQLGRHFWPDWSYVMGLRVDYLAPTIYLTDILVFLILFFWWLEKPKITVKTARTLFFSFSIFLFLLVNSLLAQNPGAALGKFFKILELALLGLYVAKNNYVLRITRYVLPFAVIYSSLIAVAQFVKQASLGGIFWWLGERTFNAGTPGIAKAVVAGRLLMRPYATFSHPNALAGFILVSLILTLPFIRRRLYAIGYTLLTVTAIILSFSRSVWLVGAFILLYVFFLKIKPKLFLPAIIVFSEEALVQRALLNKIALQLLKLHPLTGVGLNNFIVYLPEFRQATTQIYWLQPVHNIYLLIAAETGLVGLLVFLWFIFLTYKKLIINNYQLLIAISTILALGLFDHYWLTLQQTQLLFAVILGLCWVSRHRPVLE